MRLKYFVENKKCRFLVLFLAVAIGVVINFFISDCFVEGLFKGISPEYVRGIITSILVITLLWVFRTYDTRQQILQSKFFGGLENLTDKDPLKIEIGVFQLCNLSKSDDQFDDDIRLAFIKRMKNCPLESSEIERYENIIDPSDRFHNEMRKDQPDEWKPKPGIRLTYAQYILQWLIDHQKHGLDLSGSDFSQQDFVIDNLPLGKIFTRKNKSNNCIFVNADMYNTDLKNAYLVNADMHSANLGDSHLEYADLTNSILEYSCPFGAFVNCETKGFDNYDIEQDVQGKMRIA